MRVVIAGGTGFLGGALVKALLEQQHGVVLLSRSAAGTDPAAPLPRPGEVRRAGWRPDGTAGDWGRVLDAADVVVNLAGESIAAVRWSDERRQAILESRIQATRSLVAACRQAGRRPGVFVSASAQGYYGDRGDEVLTEEAGPGDDYLARVCREWEAEALQVSAFSRVVLLRTGIVLDRDEGALPQMVRPFKLFAGGPLGSGRQWMSWIHRDDWVRLAVLAMEDERFAGPLNLGSPHPVPNLEFARALGKVLGRPSWIRTPAVALRAAVGEMADALLLASQRMAPARALALGYRFVHPEVYPALAEMLR